MNTSILIENREKAVVRGAVSVVNITEKEVFLSTEDGDLKITGSCFEGDSFEPEKKLFIFSGRIDSIRFTTEKQHLPDNIISKLFR